MKVGDTVRRLGEDKKYKVKLLKSDNRGIRIQLHNDDMHFDVFHCAKYFEVVA